MKSRRNKRLNRICCHQFEDRIAFYSKWQVPVRGSVGLPRLGDPPSWRRSALGCHLPSGAPGRAAGGRALGRDGASLSGLREKDGRAGEQPCLVLLVRCVEEDEIIHTQMIVHQTCFYDKYYTKA